ncbi:hypothetical protein [Bacillus litorisediminis]|nr:hypothetical protein [Bacillus litorisediminis]
MRFMKHGDGSSVSARKHRGIRAISGAEVVLFIEIGVNSGWQL